MAPPIMALEIAREWNDLAEDFNEGRLDPDQLLAELKARQDIRAERLDEPLGIDLAFLQHFETAWRLGARLRFVDKFDDRERVSGDGRDISRNDAMAAGVAGIEPVMLFVGMGHIATCGPGHVAGPRAACAQIPGVAPL